MKKLIIITPHLSTGGLPQYILKKIDMLNNNYDLHCIEVDNISNEYTIQKEKISNIIGDKLYQIDKNEDIIEVINDIEPDIIWFEEIYNIFIDIETIKEIWENKKYEIYTSSHTSKDCSIHLNDLYLPDKFILVSDYQSKYYSKYNLPIEIIEYPIDISDRDKFKLRDSIGFERGYYHIIQVGLFSEHKNQSYTIELAKNFIDFPIKFHFIGNLANNFKNYWQPLLDNLPSNCIIHNEIENVDDYMRSADLLIHPSKEELNPLVIKEALKYKDLNILISKIPTHLFHYKEIIYENIEFLQNDLEIDHLQIISELIFKRVTLRGEFNEHQREILEGAGFNLNPKKLKYTDYIIEIDEDIDDNFFNKIANGIIEMDNSKDVHWITRLNKSKVNNSNSFKERIINIIDPVGFIRVDYNNGATISIDKNAPDNDYFVVFRSNDKIIYETTIQRGMWTSPSIKYYIEWEVEVYLDDGLIFHDEFNLNEKKVRIIFDSNAMGDTLAWIPYLDEFRNIHNCELYVYCNYSDLFKGEYPDIHFSKDKMNDSYATYRIGWYYQEDSDDMNFNMNPFNFRVQPLQKTITDILGMEFEEIKPKITYSKRVKKSKKVGIAIHSTSQVKYWNRENGWQEVVDYLNKEGYEVILYSKEWDGYMGNNNPKGVIKFKGDLNEVIVDLSECEFFIGLPSGLSWLAWSVDVPVIMIQTCSSPIVEFKSNRIPVINEVEYSDKNCFTHHRMDRHNWNWCPCQPKYSCSSNITSIDVINKIGILINKE